MRHLWSLLAGVVAAPLAWLCLATGQYQSSRTVAEWNEENLFDTAELIGPAAFLVAAGVLLGLVGTLRWSPAGPLVAGVLFVVPTIFMFIDPFRTLDAFSVDRPRTLLDQDYQPWLPLENGTLLVLGALLLMAVFSASRWRRWPAAAAPLPATTVQETAVGTGVASAPAPMTDEEILAAAAAMEEEEKATAPAEAPVAAAEPPKQAEPAEAATPAKSSPEATEEPDNDESSTRSGTSAKS
jgi:hypothetical protein